MEQKLKVMEAEYNKKHGTMPLPDNRYGDFLDEQYEDGSAKVVPVQKKWKKNKRPTLI